MIRLGWLIIVALGSVLVPMAAEASPWTLPRGKGVLTTGFGFQTADREFLDGGGAQVFPLEGRYDAAQLTLGARLGITNRLEVEMSVPLSVVSYQSDPVILVDGAGFTFDDFQRNVINLSQTQVGFSDLRAFARYRLLRGPMVLTWEAGTKIPLGYDGPAGTFGERPSSSEEFANNLTRFATPDNVQDDVTLGDGQVDLQSSLLLGYATSFGFFGRLSAGYNLRLGGAADQFIGLARIGQSIGRRVLVYGGAEVAVAVQEGRLIGISVAALDPRLPAEDYGGAENLNLRELQLKRNAVIVGGGVIVRLTRRLEFNGGYDYTVWGRNTAAIHSLVMSLALRVDIF